MRAHVYELFQTLRPYARTGVVRGALTGFFASKVESLVNTAEYLEQALAARPALIMADARKLSSAGDVATGLVLATVGEELLYCPWFAEESNPMPIRGVSLDEAADVFLASLGEKWSVAGFLADQMTLLAQQIGWAQAQAIPGFGHLVRPKDPREIGFAKGDLVTWGDGRGGIRMHDMSRYGAGPFEVIGVEKAEGRGPHPQLVTIARRVNGVLYDWVDKRIGWKFPIGASGGKQTFSGSYFKYAPGLGWMRGLSN